MPKDKSKPPCLNRNQDERPTPWNTEPFTFEEAEEVKNQLRDLGGENGEYPEETVSRCWPKIRHEVSVCAASIQVDDLIKKNDGNTWRPLKTAKDKGKWGTVLKDDIYYQAALYGARQCGFGDDLENFTPDQIRKSVDRAISDLKSLRGRPKDQSVLEYGSTLSQTYLEITGSYPGSYWEKGTDIPKGPAIRFFKACLAPVSTMHAPGIRKFFKKIKSM